MLFPLSHLFVNILMNYSWVYMAALFLEFGLVFLASGAARRNTPAALPLFLVYSALNGFTLSFIIVTDRINQQFDEIIDLNEYIDL